MKIDGNMLSAQALRQRPAGNGDNSLSSSTGGGGGSPFSRNIPTIEPSSSMPSGLANALWLAKLEKAEKAEQESASLLSEFQELTKMTPIERVRKELLEKMGLTEESLAALPEEQRKAIEEEIRRAIKERLGIDETQQAGTAVGQTAAGKEEAEV